MIVTKEMKEKIDKNGFPDDFIFCSNCETFNSIAHKKVGDEIVCINCLTYKYFS
jgi:formylmethanofuran dehydrogenase subunit E